MAATNPIKLAIDRQNLVIASQLGFASSLPALYQGDVRDLIVQVVDPASTPGSFTIVTAGTQGFACLVTLSATPKGDGTQTIYSGPLTLTWDNGNNWFYGPLDLTGANIATAIGTAPSCSATMQIELRQNAVNQTIYQNDNGVTIYAPANGIATVAPGQPSLYETRAEAEAKYFQKGPVAGQGFFLVSPDGTKIWQIVAGDDGGPPQFQPVQGPLS